MPVKATTDSVTITLDSNPETSVKVLNFGATVVSWKVNGQEKLWLSDSSKLDGTRAVRGGIPLVFPRFGPPSGNHPATDKLPQHGFARSVPWEFLGEVDASTVQFGLGPENLTAEFKDAWPYDFTLIYTVKLGAETLDVSLSVENREVSKPFDFNVLFHTYYRVPDVSKVNVVGFQNLEFWDKVVSSDKSSADEPKINFVGETDRVYKATPNKCTITFEEKPIFEIDSLNTKDTVVWNPWSEASKNMSDFSPADGFNHMVCVENGSVAKFLTLDPGAKWEAAIHVKTF